MIALFWDRRAWSVSRLQSRLIAVPLARRRVPLGNVLSGGLLVLMGALTSLLAVTGQAMDTAEWQVRAGAWLQHVASVILNGLSWLPGWAGALLVFGALALVITVAVRQTTRPTDRGSGSAPDQDAVPGEVGGVRAADEPATAEPLVPTASTATPHPMETLP